MLGDMFMVISIREFPYLNKPEDKSSPLKRKPHDKVAYRYMDPSYQLAGRSGSRVQSFTGVHYPTLPHSQAAKINKSLDTICKLCWDHRQDINDKDSLTHRVFSYRLSWLVDDNEMAMGKYVLLEALGDETLLYKSPKLHAPVQQAVRQKARQEITTSLPVAAMLNVNSA
jgi:hypothetical protein